MDNRQQVGIDVGNLLVLAAIAAACWSFRAPQWYMGLLLGSVALGMAAEIIDASLMGRIGWIGKSFLVYVAVAFWVFGLAYAWLNGAGWLAAYLAPTTAVALYFLASGWVSQTQTEQAAYDHK